MPEPISDADLAELRTALVREAHALRASRSKRAASVAIMLSLVARIDEAEGEGCTLHGHAPHGQEAEELQKGIEELLANTSINWSVSRLAEELQKLLDRVDARDSLAHQRANEELAQARREQDEARAALEPAAPATTLPLIAGPMVQKPITWFDKPARVCCDGRCDKAWGINARPRVYLSRDRDDYAYLADHELEQAPADPGTYEGGHGKPANRQLSQTDAGLMNKWCSRECERSHVVEASEAYDPIDFTKRHRNMGGGM